ncbi:MAG TPA: ABC transporter permease [Euzebyales bacterium]
MTFIESMRVALTAIRANRLRSGLTVLGVVIGVLSVVLLVAVGSGARAVVTAGVEDLGSNLLLVAPGSFEFGQAPTRSQFTLEDIESLSRQLRDRARVTGSIASGERVRSDTGAAFTSVIGVTADFDDVVNRPIARGEFLNESDLATARRVAVLGATAADGLFGGIDPIARQITVGGLRFRVIGTVEPLGSALGVDRDSQVYVPLTAAQRLFGIRTIDTLFVRADDRDGLDDVTATIERVLSERFEPDEFSILSQDEILGVAGRILDTLTLVLAAIAGISLLVGGIGVSNIMLVSVSERTREIGLRKALGARTSEITRQFLVEAIVLCGIGGVLGVAGGVGLSYVAERFTPVPAEVTWWSVALAFGVSVAVGVIFGVFPARRAGRMDPVAALRRE